jgi:hypothetical protein
MKRALPSAFSVHLLEFLFNKQYNFHRVYQVTQECANNTGSVQK